MPYFKIMRWSRHPVRYGKNSRREAQLLDRAVFDNRVPSASLRFPDCLLHSDAIAAQLTRNERQFVFDNGQVSLRKLLSFSHVIGLVALIALSGCGQRSSESGHDNYDAVRSAEGRSWRERWTDRRRKPTVRYRAAWL